MINSDYNNVVKMPREAALDAEFLHVASQLGLEQTRRLHTGFKSYEISDFISRLRAQFSSSSSSSSSDPSSSSSQAVEEEEEEEGGGRGFNWAALGKAAAPKFHTTPSANFMYVYYI